MSLKLKLWIVLGIPAVFIAAIVIWMRQTSGMIARELDDARSYHLSVVRHVSQMKVNVVEVWQYFTDISATRARDGLDDGYAQAAKCRESFLKAMAVVRGLEQRGQNDERVAMLDKTKEAFEVYYRSGRIMAEAYVQDGTDAGNKFMKPFDETAEGLSKLMDPLIEESSKGLEDALERVDRQTYFQRDAVMYAGLFAVAGGLVVASIARRSIRKPMQRIIASLSTESSSLSSASGQVSQSSLRVSERASAQASALEATSASLEELTAMISLNSEGALKVDALARRAKETAEIGIGQVQEMNTAMGAIRGSSGEIAAIVKTINEIAFQTNILALNAAVEAARAGEAGAGFAVVAEEVRNLAKRSAEAANETTAKIARAIDISQHGVNYSEQVAQAFKTIEEEARELAMLSSEVSRACVEQTQGIHQINQAVSEMDSTTQANAADAEHSSELATSLHGQAGALNETIGDLVQLIDGRGAMERWKSENQVT